MFTFRQQGRRLVQGTLVASLLTSAVMTAAPAQAADGTVHCRPVPPAAANMAVATQVFTTGRTMGVSDRVMLAGFEAAIVESHVNNCSNGDADSVGVFQQRASWGTFAQRTTVSYAARRFFERAVNVDRTAAPSVSAGAIAQKVQVSAYPSRYDYERQSAQRLIDQLKGLPTAAPQISTATVGTTGVPGTTRGWSVAANGAVTPFGGAPALGDARGVALNKPIVAITTTASGNGYWLAASDGGVFSFGDARFYGSMGGQPLNQPVVGLARTATGHGYWLVAGDGGIFSFGDAGFHGAATTAGGRAVGMATYGGGYEVALVDGRIVYLP